ncbi:AAA family ATPase [Caulobacter sp. KR2-114]|uniref:AAA family ATPase n=1 Tax=Caulobacter sp. KR2-114 TaxID=3400912 RepID=UPI003C0F1F7E
MSRDLEDLVVLTGGPGAGKTTLIAELQRRGHRARPESARRILKDQALFGGRATGPTDPALFAETIMAWEVRTWVEEQACEGRVFFDRAVPEAAAMLGLPPPAHFARAAARFRFARRVFIAPPWRAIYVQDEERTQTWDEALATDAACRAAYAFFGYELVELPLANVAARADFVESHCGL